MTIELKQGNLNEVTLVEGKAGQLLVLRKPQSQSKVEKTMVQVRIEHLVFGFLDNPLNRIRMRSVSEQVVFAQALRQSGIPTPHTILKDDGAQLIDYVPAAEKLSDLWLRQDSRASHATSKILDAVMSVHEADLVLGDSTGKNELVTSDAEVVLIDFDIKLSGSEVREFEIAHLVFRLSRAAHRGHTRQLPLIGEICKDILLTRRAGMLYDRDILLRYMNRFAELSTEQGATKLYGMTPIVRPEYSAELFHFLIGVLKHSV